MSDDTWTVKRILDWIEGYLDAHGDEHARLSAQWLVSEALGVSRMQLFLDLDRPLVQAERDVLRDYTKRRGSGEPLQYITGKASFRHIVVDVEPDVLIPRPETEVLVSEALSLLPAASRPRALSDDEIGALLEEGVVGNSGQGQPAEDSQQLLVADICTGTGCIACSIAMEHPGTRVIATDISDTAVDLARKNATALGLSERVDVLACDLGEGVDSSLMGTFDLVVSNPPYVPTDVLARIPREVSAYEPALALDGGQDGLGVYGRLLVWARKALKSGGGFACELHESTLDDAAAQAEYEGFCDVRIMPDLAGRPRVLVARKR